MEYKLLPGPNKQLPRVFFSSSRIDEFAPTPAVYEHYKAGTYKKGDNFNLEHCRELIDFFKSSIEKHEDWSQFDFAFSDTNTYEDISGFYREVEHQGYKITFKNIDTTYIDELVEQGQLYLFQIYNKDFSPYSKGTPNLHTMYWKMLFAPENLENVVYKLNGKAEIFYRKASIKPKDIICHKANEPIKNKDVHAQKDTSTFAYDLIKDKRFTVDKYQFHVPITMNFQAPGENKINQKLNRLLHDAEDVHVIGIDRGERNLLYLTVVDSRGNIKEQMSLNEICSYDKKNREHHKDYHQLLDERERENKSARKNWKSVNAIKELKEGYLSQVIHVITELMVKYNAIVVLEDLNFGFKRGRQKVEKQVYQKFEKMLIDKLNYLVDKNEEAQKKGGLLNAYQLTGKFESFQKLGKQSGFLYYVPAWNTSKIDPTTGFVNLFYTKYESVEKTKEFIGKLDAIVYNSEKDYFEFTFDYSKFTYKAEGSRLNWTICSYGKRIENFRNPDKNNEWDRKNIVLTKEWKNLFDQYQVSYTEGDLRTNILNLEKANFYRQFMRLFALVLQMRNSNPETGEDSMISPVLNLKGEFFESGSKPYLPLDADANGAYNIARKGLWVVEQIKKTDVDKLDKLKLAISNKEWLKYAQEHVL
jgi:CRISPR-associated protein Cpf1